MFNSTMYRCAAVVMLGIGALAACGGDDSSDGDTGPAAAVGEPAAPAEESAPGTEEPVVAGGGSSDEDRDIDGIPDLSTLELAARSFEIAYRPERIEIDGDDVHIHPGDSRLLYAGVECVVAISIFPASATVMFHRDGEVTTCE